jgi:hypothetical protein
MSLKRILRERLNGMKFSKADSGNMTQDELENHLLSLEGVFVSGEFNNVQRKDIIFDKKYSKIKPTEMLDYLERGKFFEISENYSINHEVFKNGEYEKHYIDFIHEEEMVFDTGIKAYEIPKEAHIKYKIKNSF